MQEKYWLVENGADPPRLLRSHPSGGGDIANVLVG